MVAFYYLSKVLFTHHCFQQELETDYLLQTEVGFQVQESPRKRQHLQPLLPQMPLLDQI
jgi:hypothetical protein